MPVYRTLILYIEHLHYNCVGSSSGPPAWGGNGVPWSKSLLEQVQRRARGWWRTEAPPHWGTSSLGQAEETGSVHPEGSVETSQQDSSTWRALLGSWRGTLHHCCDRTRSKLKKGKFRLAIGKEFSPVQEARLCHTSPREAVGAATPATFKAGLDGAAWSTGRCPCPWQRSWD